MTDEELRRHFRQGGEAAPDFRKILERPKRRYRPRPLAIGLLILLIVLAPAGWVWTNIGEERLASVSPRRETVTQNRPLVRPTPEPAPVAAALAPAPVATGVSKPPAATQAAACTPVPVTRPLPMPPYPAISARLGESGSTLLEVTVARNGLVSGVKVIKSSGFARLDEAAASFGRQNYVWQPLACASAKTLVRVIWTLRDRR